MDWPQVEVENDATGYRWRIVWGNEASEWYEYYSGILVHTFSDGRKFGAASAYWEDTLPELCAFQIVEH